MREGVEERPPGPVTQRRDGEEPAVVEGAVGDRQGRSPRREGLPTAPSGELRIEVARGREPIERGIRTTLGEGPHPRHQALAIAVHDDRVPVRLHALSMEGEHLFEGEALLGRHATRAAQAPRVHRAEGQLAQRGRLRERLRLVLHAPANAREGHRRERSLGWMAGRPSGDGEGDRGADPEDVLVAPGLAGDHRVAAQVDHLDARKPAPERRAHAPVDPPVEERAVGHKGDDAAPRVAADDLGGPPEEAHVVVREHPELTLSEAPPVGTAAEVFEQRGAHLGVGAAGPTGPGRVPEHDQGPPGQRAEVEALQGVALRERQGPARLAHGPGEGALRRGESAGVHVEPSDDPRRPLSAPRDGQRSRQEGPGPAGGIDEGELRRGEPRAQTERAPRHAVRRDREGPARATAGCGRCPALGGDPDPPGGPRPAARPPARRLAPLRWSPRDPTSPGVLPSGEPRSAASEESHIWRGTHRSWYFARHPVPKLPGLAGAGDDRDMGWRIAMSSRKTHRFVAMIAALTVAGSAASAAAQGDWDPEAGDTGQWAPPPQQQQPPPQQPPPQQQQPPQWQQQPPPQQQQQQQQGQWYGQGDEERPPALAGEQPGDPGGQSDHAQMVGNAGFTFFGVQRLPIGVTATDTSGVLRAPTVGIRYWLSEGLGLDVGLGFSFASLSSEVTDGTGTKVIVDGSVDSTFGLNIHAGLPVALSHKQPLRHPLHPGAGLRLRLGDLPEQRGPGVRPGSDRAAHPGGRPARRRGALRLLEPPEPLAPGEHRPGHQLLLRRGEELGRLRGRRRRGDGDQTSASPPP